MNSQTKVIMLFFLSFFLSVCVSARKSLSSDNVFNHLHLLRLNNDISAIVCFTYQSAGPGRWEGQEVVAADVEMLEQATISYFGRQQFDLHFLCLNNDISENVCFTHQSAGPEVVAADVEMLEQATISYFGRQQFDLHFLCLNNDISENVCFTYQSARPGRWEGREVVAADVEVLEQATISYFGRQQFDQVVRNIELHQAWQPRLFTAV